MRQNGQTVLVIGRNSFSPRETTIKRMQIADTVTWVRGRHTFKAGVDVNHDKILNFFPGNFGGVLPLQHRGQLQPRRAQRLRRALRAGVPRPRAPPVPETHPDITEYAAFVQDEWKPRANLTLSLGLRYDLQSFAQPQVRNPDPQLAAAGIDTSFLATDKNNFAPRLGRGLERRTRRPCVRAGYGLFYGRTPSIMVGTAHSNNGINVQTITLTGQPGAGDLVYPRVLATIPTGAAAARPEHLRLRPRLREPRGAPGQRGDRARAARRPGGRRRATFRGRTEPAAVARLQRRAPRCRPRSRSRAAAVGDHRPVPDRAALHELRPHHPLREHRGVELQRPHPRDPASASAARLQASLAYTLGKVEDTKPDADRGRARAARRRRQARRPTRPTSTPTTRAGRQRPAPPRGLQRRTGTWATAKDAGGLTRGAARRLVAELDRQRRHRPAVLASSSPTTSTATATPATTSCPAAATPSGCPRPTCVDLRLARRIAHRLAGEPGADRGGLQPAEQHEHLRPAQHVLQLHGGVLVPQANFGEDLPPPPRGRRHPADRAAGAEGHVLERVIARRARDMDVA